MNLFKRFSLALMALVVTAMLLVACGDSPTPAPAATTAAATTAPATTAAPTATTAPKPTTAAPTTAAPTTAAPKPTTAVATTAPATTAASTGTLPVPAGTKALKLTPTLTKGLVGLFAQGAGTTNVAFEAYVTDQTPVDLSKFYDQKLVELGYTSHPETQHSTHQGDASFLSASFTRGNQVLSIALVGPVDQAILDEIAGMETVSSVSSDQDFTKQVKAGDTLIMSFTLAGTLPVPSTTAAPTVAAPTTAAAGTSDIPAPDSATELKLSAGLEKALTDEFGKSAGNPSLKAYVTGDDFEENAAFYESTLPNAGYTLVPDSQVRDSKDDVNILTAGFTNGKDVVVVAILGPLDDATINELVGLDPAAAVPATDLTKQVKVGDSIIFVVSGTK